MANETAELARYVAGLDFSEIPQEVMLRAKCLAADLLGCAVRASVEAESTTSLLAAVERLGLSAGGQCAVAGLREKYPPPIAALLNGAFGHSLDFDDTHAVSSLHPSAVVVPAALAAAGLCAADGRTILTAIVAGFEVCCRIGVALDPTAHYRRGFHPTATAGTFGAAAAAAKVLGLSAGEIEFAFGVAGSQAAGSLQFLENGAWNKRFQVGAAAMNGVIAATLAGAGFRGSSQALEGKHGFFAGYSGGADASRAIAGLGGGYETMKIGVKLYPGCRYTHAALDGLLALRKEHALDVEKIERVEIGLHRNGITLTAAPEDAKRRPANVVDAQFSIYFAAAVALRKGSFGWNDYRLIGDRDVESLAAKVSANRSERVERGAHPFGATVRIECGPKSYCMDVADPSGEPQSFPSVDQLRAKFIGLSEPVLGARAGELWSAVLALDSATSARDVMSALRAG